MCRNSHGVCATGTVVLGFIHFRNVLTVWKNQQIHYADELCKGPFEISSLCARYGGSLERRRILRTDSRVLYGAPHKRCRHSNSAEGEITCVNNVFHILETISIVIHYPVALAPLRLITSRTRRCVPRLAWVSYFVGDKIMYKMNFWQSDIQNRRTLNRIDLTSVRETAA